MRKLPAFAQIYLVAVSIAGLGCLYLGSGPLLREISSARFEVLIFLLLAILAGGKKISLPTKHVKSDGSSMTLGFGVVLAAMVSVGPGTAVAASVLACLSGCLYPKRQQLHQVVFNVTLSAVEAWIGATVYEQFHSPAVMSNSVLFFALVTSSALTYYAVNTFGVSIILGLCDRESPAKIWKEEFIWSAPGYFATATVTALATLILRGSNAGLLLFLLPVVYLFFQIMTGYQKRMQEQEQHEEAMRVSQAHLADLYLAAIKSLALAIDAKDQYTHQHIIRVQRYAVAIAKEMGFTGSDLEAVNTGALLHDIGKIGVPEYVLMKPGRLSADEFEKIKKHPEIGAAILDPVEFPWPVLPVVRSHHEKWDGTGYPDGLAGENIPLSARIMAVADVYDALTSTRSYRTAWTHQRAVDVIQKDAGTHFDPAVVEVFLKIIDGVVEEMAAQGEGPLAPKVAQDFGSMDKTAQAAHQISKTSTELYALYEVMRSLTERLSVQELTESLCRKLQNSYPGGLFVVLLGNGMDQSLVARTAQGINADFFHGAKALSPSCVTAKALLEGKTYHGSYNQDDLLLNAVEGKSWEQIQTQIVVPMSFEGKELGTLNCYHSEADAFSEHDAVLLETVGRQAAESIYNSLLASRLQSEEGIDQLTHTRTLKRLSNEVETQRMGRDAAEKSGFSLLCVDVDAFSAINDIFGHGKADTLLCDVAELLKSVFATEDGIARYGSDQFVVVVPKSLFVGRDNVQEKLAQALKAREIGLYHASAGNFHVSLTLGAAGFPEAGGNFASVFLAAERDLREQKALKKLKPFSDQNAQLLPQAA